MSAEDKVDSLKEVVSKSLPPDLNSSLETLKKMVDQASRSQDISSLKGAVDFIYYLQAI